MQKLEKCYVGKPDAGKLARPVWRGLGGNVFRKEQRAALPPYATGKIAVVGLMIGNDLRNSHF